MTSLRQFEYLVTVVDCGSFTAAAALLHVTQPALSHQVRALERSLGGPLLERLPRSVRLTPMGRAVLPYARAALADAEKARRAARQARGLERGELQLATLFSVSLGVLPPVLRAWHRSHGQVRVRLFEHRHADELAAAMAAGRADLAVGPVPPDWPGAIRALDAEEFVIVLPADDPAVEASDDTGHLDTRALAGHAWVHYTPDHGLAAVLEQTCAAAGFRPQAAIRTEQTATAPLLAAAGLGPALVPANVIPPHFDGAVRRPRPAVRRPLAGFTRGDPDPLTAGFLDILARYACVMPEHVRRWLRDPSRAWRPGGR